ncbi:uncharacterized protein [Palaemon carinicauda]|uniref:uncharacterized protein n=1 Tax=Palaemon carinicauda TaxID=392227 RepID=UPI0035B5D6A6
MGWQNSDKLVSLTLHLLPKNQIRNVAIDDTDLRQHLESTLKDRDTCFFTLKTWQKTTIGISLNLGHGCWEQNDCPQYDGYMYQRIAYPQPSIVAIFYRGSVNFSAKLLYQ